MKRLLILSFAVLFSFGFTLNGDKNSEKISECPYLNKIHSSIEKESGECPFFKGKVEKQESKSEKNVCPYLDSQKESKSKCPYLNGEMKEDNKTKTNQPGKVFKLKST